MGETHRPRTLGIGPETTIAALAAHPILEALTGPQLVVYIRLLGQVALQRRRTFEVRNAELYREPRTAMRSLHQLRDLGLVKISFASGNRFGRKVEVVK